MSADPSVPQTSQIDTAIFIDLQKKIDDDTDIRDKLKTIVDTLSKLGRITQSILSRIHNVPTSQLADTVLKPAAEAVAAQTQTVRGLAEAASQYPFYKWNGIWQRDVQNLISSMQLVGWLGQGKLVSVEEIGAELGGKFAVHLASFFLLPPCSLFGGKVLIVIVVPVNVKDQDTFHVTIEDYLLALCSTIEELARLAPNAVTMGDYTRPLQVSRFIKDVHAGFQLLNLKNDALRRRSDGIKYSVKKVEDVVYDLSLRGLVPKDEHTSG